MTNALREAWVSELKSGKYKQTFGRLKAGEDCYCALGVLCHVLKTQFPEVLYKNNITINEQSHDMVVSSDQWNAFAQLMYELGFNIATQSTIVEANDRKRMSLPEIGAMIEGIGRT
jgi:hypothetical protein